MLSLSTRTHARLSLQIDGCARGSAMVRGCPRFAGVGLLDPVDAVTVTMLMDDSLDLFMPDQGVAHRVTPQMPPSVPCAVMADREVTDALIAEHGFSALVTVTNGESRRHVLFDAGASPNGVMRTCAGWISILPTAKRSCAATVTSTTPRGLPDCCGAGVLPDAGGDSSAFLAAPAGDVARTRADGVADDERVRAARQRL